MKPNSNPIDCDVLVVGGGLAGAWAALRAKELVDNVILIDKSRAGKSGMSYFASGVLVFWTPEDPIYPWMKEIAEGGAYLNDQKWLEVVLRENYERIKSMDRWSEGLIFEKDNNGNIERIKGRGHQESRLIMFHGPELMETMRRQLEKKKIKVIDRIMVTDLLTSDGKHPTDGGVVGAIGIHTRNGEVQLFRAKATVLSCGSIEAKVGGHYCMNVSGDSYGMEYRVGAQMTGMEFLPMGNISVWDRKYLTVGINMIQAYGLKIRNNIGERFLEKYEPILKERSQLYTLAQAIAKEGLEGRGPVYADMRSFTPEVIERLKRVIPKFTRIFENAGIDITKELIELTPGVRMRMPVCASGARIINLNAATSIPGLFGAGAACKAPSHGGDEGVGGFNLTYCTVSGYRAGENAALYAKQFKEDRPDIDLNQSNALEEKMLTPLSRKDGIMPDEVFEKLNMLYIPAQFSVFKSEKRIQRVLELTKQLRENELPRLKAPDIHELVKANETINFVTSIELAYNAALFRKESRTYHYRVDFPYRDDMNWLKWVIIKRGNRDEMQISTESVPIEEYPVKPANRERIDVPIKIDIKES